MVYRPPKKSPAGPRFPGSPASSDPLSGPLSRAADGEEIVPGDDRNLVVVDQSYAGGDFEDRLWLFWRRQKNNLFLAAALVCVGVIGWQGMKLYQQHVADALQAEYQAAEGAPALLAFAQSHADTTFGKLAQLEAADAFYKDGKFADAAKAYADAATVWGLENYGQRARVGVAMSLLRNNDAAGAHKQFEALANDTQSVAYYRSEAAFDLAVLDSQAGNPKSAAQWMDRVKSLKDPTWLSEITTFTQLISTFPGANPPATPTSEKPLVLTNTTAPTKPAASVSATPAAAAPTASAPKAPAAKPAPAPAAATTTGGFDLTPLLKAAGSTSQ